ncbi:MAG: glycosyltransferase family 39 protein [Nitrososphaerota archaeon]|nr:glycosyltransferase family 39 protein [Nitrososphaerota archaeon]MDG6924119.1 glycosyltransferase family 39 protein [Nitrososphaerota archaeon]
MADSESTIEPASDQLELQQATNNHQEQATFTKRVEEFVIGKFGSFKISHLLLILFGLHLFAMSFPSGSTCTGSSGDCVFDEAYYVPAAKDLLQFIPSNLEHPFFGKIWGALGIFFFGNDFFGWRIFYVVIGVLSVWALYQVALNFFSREKSLFVASMLGFETLFFIHTSLNLLEGPPIFFALLGFMAYFKKKYYWAGVAFGLSILSKEWGVYFVIVLFLYHVWATKHDSLSKLLSGQSLKRLLTFILVLFLVVSLPLWAYDAAYHPYTQTQDIVSTVVVVSPDGSSNTTTTTTTTTHGGYLTNPFQNLFYYFTYASSLRATQNDTQLYPWVYLPWMWIIPLDINPQQYYVTTVTVTTTGPNNTILSQKELHPIDWLGIGNLVIWYSIWLIGAVLVIKILTKNITALDAFISAWIFGTYGPPLFEYFAFDRVSYPFYFVNVDPGLALGIPMVIAFIAPDNPNQQRFLMLFWLAAALVFFILFFPVHPLAFG